MSASESEKAETSIKNVKELPSYKNKKYHNFLTSLSRQYVRNSMGLCEMRTKIKGSCSETGKEHNLISQKSGCRNHMPGLLEICLFHFC